MARRVYLADQNADVRTATENLLAEFLREMRTVAAVQHVRDQRSKARKAADLAESVRRTESDMENLPDITTLGPERGAFLPEIDENLKSDATSPINDSMTEDDYRDTGAWVSGQGVKIDYAAIVEILLRQLDPPRMLTCDNPHSLSNIMTLQRSPSNNKPRWRGYRHCSNLQRTS